MCGIRLIDGDWLSNSLSSTVECLIDVVHTVCLINVLTETDIVCCNSLFLVNNLRVTNPVEARPSLFGLSASVIRARDLPRLPQRYEDSVKRRK